MKLFIVANPSKPNVRRALDEWLPWMKTRAQVLGVDTDCCSDLSDVTADVILALGGDGAASADVAAGARGLRDRRLGDVRLRERDGGVPRAAARRDGAQRRRHRR